MGYFNSFSFLGGHPVSLFVPMSLVLHNVQMAQNKEELNPSSHTRGIKMGLPSTEEKRSVHQLDGLTVRADMYAQ